MREVDHSYPLRAKVKNKWRFTPTLPKCFHGVKRDNVNFTVAANTTDNIWRMRTGTCGNEIL